MSRWVCEQCGGPFGDEILEDFIVPGKFCSDKCLDAAVAEANAAKGAEPKS